MPFNSVACLSFSVPSLFHSASLSVRLSVCHLAGNESFSLCSVAVDLPLLLALLPGTFWGQFESRRESDTTQAAEEEGNGKCARNADQGEQRGDRVLWGSRAGPTCRQPVWHRHRVSEHVVCANL